MLFIENQEKSYFGKWKEDLLDGLVTILSEEEEVKKQVIVNYKDGQQVALNE